VNKIEKLWYRLTYNQTINKQFTASYYEDLLFKWGEEYGFIDFYEKGNGIILRKDVDDNLDKAVKMAEIDKKVNDNLNRTMFLHENKPFIKSTYFILNTAKYWNSKELIPIILYIQDLGYEIGFHNNAITDHIKTGRDIESCIREPLDYLRKNGIIIRGTAAHGDRLCKQMRFINYNIWGFKTPGYEYWKGPFLNLSDYDLEYEAYNIPYDYYLADSHEKWNGYKNESQWKDKRIQVVIHPQNWRI
jgi:hypothetical protein